MSRRTSDVHDRLSEQDGYRPPQAGKRTDFNPPEPAFTLDYEGAAAGLQAQLQQGKKRYSMLMADGAQPAAGSNRNKYGFNVGSDYPEYGGGGGAGGRYAVILRQEGNGISIWQPVSISGDAFQTAARGKASGLTDEGPDGYLFYEDRRNPQYSIAVYENVGLIPAVKVYEAEKAGLVQSAMAQQWRAQSPIYQIEQARDRAQQQAQRDQAVPQQTPATLGKVPSVEFSLLDNGNGTYDYWVAKTSTDSQSAEGPHPGVTLVGLDFMTYSGGQTYQQLGLPKAFLAWQADGTIKPASEEWSSSQQGAMSGNRSLAYKSQSARAFFGLGPQPSRGGGGLLGDLRDLFG